MKTERAQYQAYMLRVWRDGGEAGNAWRASLESPHTGERRGFSSPEALINFLRLRLGPGAQSTLPDEQAGSEGSA